MGMTDTPEHGAAPRITAFERWWSWDLKGRDTILMPGEMAAEAILALTDLRDALARRAEAAEQIIAQCTDILIFAGADTDNGTWQCNCCYAVVGRLGDGGEPDPDPMLHDAACLYRRAMEFAEGGSDGI